MTRRFFAALLILISFMLVVMGVPFWRTIVQSEREALRTDIERDAVLLASVVEDSLTQPAILGPDQIRVDVSAVANRYRQQSGARVVIVDAAGLALVDNDGPGAVGRSFASRPEVAAALSNRVGVDQRYSQTLGRSALFVAVPVSSGGKLLGAVRLSYTTAEIDQQMRSLAWRLLLAGSLAVGTATVLAVAMARSLGRPLVALRRAARSIGAGDLRARARTGLGAPEIRALTTDFNTMASRIEELVAAQDTFVSDASHQLRSPLTAARLRVEALAYTPPDELRGEIEAAVDELGRLARIFDGLLELARSEPGPPPSALDLSPIIVERVDAWSALAAERGVALRSSPTEMRKVHVSHQRLGQILDNLIANAIDASFEGGTISVRTENTDDTVCVIVTDHGPGMTADQRLRAFDRLWRAGSRRTELSGSGLGLPIARKLARADGGDIALRAGSSGGTEAEVCYPTGR